MNLYRLQRRSDKLFFGAGSKVRDRHDRMGRFYASELTAVTAIESSGRVLTDYDLKVYDVIEKDTIDYKKLAA